MADRVIGLDIGSSSIKAAQVARSRNGSFVVERQAAAPLPRGSVLDGRIIPGQRFQVIEALRSLKREAKFASDDVIVGLNSSSAVFMQEILMPVVPPSEVAKALPGVVEHMNENLSVDEYELSYTVVGEEESANGRRVLRVLVYSVRTNYANEIAEVVSEAGFNVVGADLNALAALRAIAIKERPSRQLDALVDIGANVTILMLHHNGVPKMISFDPDSAGDVVTQRIAELLGCDEDDPQAEYAKVDDQANIGPVAQVRHDYANSTATKIATGFQNFLERSDDFDSLANVSLVGGGAYLTELRGSLRRAFGTVPLYYAEMAPNIAGPSGGPVETREDQSGGDYLVAIGLGTGARI